MSILFGGDRLPSKIKIVLKSALHFSFYFPPTCPAAAVESLLSTARCFASGGEPRSGSRGGRRRAEASLRRFKAKL